MLDKLCLYVVVGGGLSGRHASFSRFLTLSSPTRVLLRVGLDLLTAASSGGVSFCLLRGPNESISTSSSSLLDEDMLAESEFVTAGTPFFMIRRLELCELMLVRVVKEEKEVLTGFLDSGAGISLCAGRDGLRCFLGEGISTALRCRTLVGVVFRGDCTEVKPELSGGASCSPSIAAMCLLGDLRVGVGVEVLDPFRSSGSVFIWSLLGEIVASLRGRPRPRFGLEVSFGVCSRSEGDGRDDSFFTGERVRSSVLARDEVEEATIISSSSSCRGMRFLGIVNGLKKSVIFLELFDMVARPEAR